LTPILGILLCLLLMFSLDLGNWIRLAVWLLIGFVIYFTYSRSHSVMSHEHAVAHEVATAGASGAGTLRSPNDPAGPARG
jgi:hypothetical protein